MALGDVTNGMFKRVIEQFHKPENKKKVKDYVLNPVASYIEGYLKPYFLSLLICFFGMILLLLYNTKLLFDLKSKVSGSG